MTATHDPLQALRDYYPLSRDQYGALIQLVRRHAHRYVGAAGVGVAMSLLLGFVQHQPLLALIALVLAAGAGFFASHYLGEVELYRRDLEPLSALQAQTMAALLVQRPEAAIIVKGWDESRGGLRHAEFVALQMYCNIRAEAEGRALLHHALGKGAAS